MPDKAAASSDISVLQKQVDLLSNYDPVTLLPNRDRFISLLSSALISRSSFSPVCALVLIDFDGFREITNRYGYKVSDSILKIAASKIQSSLRRADFASRMEADEFHLFISGLSSSNSAMKFGERLRSLLTGIWNVDGNEVYASVTVAIVIVEDRHVCTGALFRRGAAALQKAKEQGRCGLYCYEDGLDEIVSRKFDLETALHLAVLRNELYLCYQPIVESRTGRISGVEALLRWRSGKYGEIMPSDFIPAAEASGIIVPIGSWVIDQICAQKKKWNDAGYGSFSVAINVSALQLECDNFADLLSAAMDKMGVARDSIEIEVTESAAVRSLCGSGEALNRIRNMGISLSLDDFGTGYSSLERLKTMPISVIKIDKSFVSDIGNNRFSEAIISSVVHLAGRMGLKIIAEGVETIEQVDYLTSVGCDHLQGYFFSRPVPGVEMDAFLMNERISLGRDFCYYYDI